jgi:hypothetical protein
LKAVPIDRHHLIYRKNITVIQLPKTYFTTAIVLCLLLGNSLLHGQEEEESANEIPPPAQTRTASSIGLHIITTLPLREDLYYLDGETAFPIQSVFREMPRAVYLNNTRHFRLARKTVLPDGRETFPVIAGVRLPDGIQSAIIAIEPQLVGSGNPASYKLHWFDHGLDAHPMQSARFINLSNRAVFVNIEGETFPIEPHGAVLKEFSEEQRHLTVQAGIIIEAEGRILDRSRMQTVPNTRMLYIGFPDSRREYGTVYTVIRHRDRGP